MKMTGASGSPARSRNRHLDLQIDDAEWDLTSPLRIRSMLTRRHANVVTCAVANKLVRIALRY